MVSTTDDTNERHPMVSTMDDTDGRHPMVGTTESVRQFYRQHPYPSYGEKIRAWHIPWYQKYCQTPGRYLEAGCGTGHIMLGIAASLPQHEYWAIDLSDQSIAVAERLAKDHGIAVDFRLHNMMEPLPFSFKFNYINCIGVIHHLETPETGLRNLARHLEDDGLLFLHAYGEDYHRRRLQIVEMLDLIQADSDDHETRFGLFEAYCAHNKRLTQGSWLKRLYRLSLRDLCLPLVKQVQALAGRSTSVHTWYDELERPAFSNRWLDQFANPNDRSYNLRDFCDLLSAADLEPIEMFSVGRRRDEHLPPAWTERFEQLPKADQFRLMELLNPAPTSPTVVARKRAPA